MQCTPHTDSLRHELNPQALTGEERKQEPHYLTGHVGVEHFAFDDKPELLPVPLPFLTTAEITADGGALSGGGHLADGSRAVRAPGSRHGLHRAKMTLRTRWQGVYTALESETWMISGSTQHLKGSKTVPCLRDRIY